MTRTEELVLRPEHARRPGGIAELLVIAAPMIVSTACDSFMTFTDRLFLAKLGPENMSAAMSGGMNCFAIMTLFTGLLGYSTALVAQYIGAGRKQHCAVAANQALILSLLFYPLILLGRPAIHMLFAKFPVSEAEAPLRAAYFDILIFAAIIGLLRTALCGFFSGIGRTRMVMISTLCAMLVNIIANYILIFGAMGLPAMGIRGAAYGTILGGTAGLIVLFAAYLSPGIRREYNVMKSLRIDREAMGKLLRFGSPAGVELLLNFAAFNMIIMLFQTHSQATSTAVTIMFNWDMISFVPLIGVQIGVTSLVGRYMGAGKPDIAEQAAYSGLKCGWCYSAIILMLFVFIPGLLVDVFRPADPNAVFTQAQPLAVFMIRIAAIYVMTEAVMVVFSGTLRGAGDTLWTMIASVTLHWLQVPILYVILKKTSMSPKAGWAALVVLFMSFSLVFFLRFRGGKWKSIKVVHSTEELIATDHDHDFHDHTSV